VPLRIAASSHVAPVEIADICALSASGAGRLFAGFDESLEFARRLVLCLPASCPDGRCVVLDPTPGVVLRLLAYTISFFFFRVVKAILSS